MADLEAVELWRISYDTDTKGDPICSEKIGTFASSEGGGYKGSTLTPIGVCNLFIRKNLEPVKLYLGGDNKLYPRFEVREIRVIREPKLFKEYK